MTDSPGGLTYQAAGVDRSRAARAIAAISELAKATHRPGTLGGLGGFAGAFDLSGLGYRQPVLLAGTDGVGTKLKVAMAVGKHDTVGIDLVAMCVNDVLVHGGEPLFFLDYVAMGRIEPEVIVDIATGIAAGCAAAGCVLLGGETAELPGFYDEGEYELAGFCVGVVEKDKLLAGHKVKSGDAIVGIASSGVHSNGLSLVRKIVEVAKLDLGATVPELGRTLGEELLEPTVIYTKVVRDLLSQVDVHSFVHVTGGGIPGNVVRMLPEGTSAEFSRSRWPVPPIFDLLARWGNVHASSMFETFNMGLGMLVILPEEHVDRAIEICRAHELSAWAVGKVVPGDGDVRILA